MKRNNGNLLWIALVVAAASTLVAGAWASAGGGNGVPDQIAALEQMVAKQRSETARLNSRIDTEVARLTAADAALKAQLETQKQAIASGDTALQAQLNDQKKAIQDGDAALQAQLDALQAKLDMLRP